MFKTRIGNGLFRKQLVKSRLNKERANLSFFFVVMFFAVFGIIVLTEVLLIDEKGRGQGVQVRKGFGGRLRYGERSDYEDQVSGKTSSRVLSTIFKGTEATIVFKCHAGHFSYLLVRD